VPRKGPIGGSIADIKVTKELVCLGPHQPTCLPVDVGIGQLADAEAVSVSLRYEPEATRALVWLG